MTICIYQSDGKGAIGLFYNPSAQYVATINAGIEATVSVSGHLVTGYNRLFFFQNILHDVQISLENNTLICKFKQLINPPLNIQNRVFPLNSKLYHIFLATGQFDSQRKSAMRLPRKIQLRFSDNVPFMHDAPPFISPLVNLSTNQTAVADNGDPTTGAMKAHGTVSAYSFENDQSFSNDFRHLDDLRVVDFHRQWYADRQIFQICHEHRILWYQIVVLCKFILIGWRDVYRMRDFDFLATLHVQHLGSPLYNFGFRLYFRSH